MDEFKSIMDNENEDIGQGMPVNTPADMPVPEQPVEENMPEQPVGTYVPEQTAEDYAAGNPAAFGPEQPDEAAVPEQAAESFAADHPAGSYVPEQPAEPVYGDAASTGHVSDGSGAGQSYDDPYGRGQAFVRSSYDPNGRYDDRSVYRGQDAGEAGSAGTGAAVDQQGIYGGRSVNRSYESGIYSRNAGQTSDQNGYRTSARDSEPQYQQGIYGGLPRGAAGREQGSAESASKYDSYRFNDPEGLGGLDGTRSAKPRKKSLLTRILAVVVAVALLAGCFSAIGYTGYRIFTDHVAGKSAVTEQPAQEAVPTPELHLGNQDRETAESGTASSEAEAGTREGASRATYSGEELTVGEVVELCMPSMVAITNTSVTEYRNMFGETRSYEDVSAGSGIIVGETDTELLIATNNHVISGAKDITVTFVDDTAISGSIKGTDAENDLAIVAVEIADLSEETMGAVRIINIGDSDKCVVGESVVAIGNALGYGQTVTAGIVSALNREVTVDGTKHILLQTDASINPGNSGGALINMRGELIGINEVKYADTSVEGFGYAIPMATAEPILTELGSKVPREKIVGEDASYIGITCKTVPSYYTQMGYPSGVYVSTVNEGGPAEAAGIVSGDIITAIDGVSVRSTDELIEQLTYYAAGETIKFRIRRMNEDQSAFDTMDIMVTLGRRTDSNLFENTEPT